MEDKLSLEILTMLERIKSAGRETVKSEILNMTSFAAIGQDEFVSAWEKLLANGCIQEFRNDQKNNAREYRLNSNKDCVTIFSAKMQEYTQSVFKKSELEKLELEIHKLTLERLHYENTIRDLQKSLAEAQLKDIPKNASDRKTALKWAIIVAIIGWLGFLREILKD